MGPTVCAGCSLVFALLSNPYHPKKGGARKGSPFFTFYSLGVQWLANAFQVAISTANQSSAQYFVTPPVLSAPQSKGDSESCHPECGEESAASRTLPNSAKLLFADPLL
jgi:hypothetical protein